MPRPPHTRRRQSDTHRRLFSVEAGWRRNALAQVAAGAHMLDVNAVTGEEERLEAVLPLVARHGAAVVAISNDESAISEDPDVRFNVARKIVNRAADHGIARADVVVDPLVMPVAATPTAAQQVFRLLRRLREELAVNATLGASNVSFGLPNRVGINATFLAMAAANGLTSAITNPLEPAIGQAIRASNVLRGHDPDCRTWISAYRQPGDTVRNRRRRTQRRPKPNG